jgi:hypothetical protein
LSRMPLIALSWTSCLKKAGYISRGSSALKEALP